MFQNWERGIGALFFILCFEVNCFHEAVHNFRFTGIFTFVFAQFTGVVIESPAFGDFYGKEFNHNITRDDSRKIIGKVGPDAE